jgi:GntR family transcriptional regulator
VKGGKQALWFSINPRSSVPIYQQIKEQVRKGIDGGLLEPGDRLPSVRELAAQLLVNPNTVAKAYQELELEGVVATVRGRGTFVSESARRASREERVEMLKQMMERLLEESQHLQLSREEMEACFHEVLKEWGGGGNHAGD